MGIRFVVLLLSCVGVSLASCGAGPSELPASAAEATSPEEVVSSDRPPPDRHPEETTPEGSGETPPAEWTACSADADCEAIEIACCDHCNGGELMSVNRAHKAEAIARYRAQCGPTMCTKMACMGPDPVCREGTCSLTHHPTR